jgi:hypothetical protein
VKSQTTPEFRSALKRLPAGVRRAAQRAYRQFSRDPAHPSLAFKRVHAPENVWSVRVSIGYRALGFRVGGEIVWFWIGSHADYDAILRRR